MDKKLIVFLLLFSGFYFLYYKFVLQPIEKKQPVKTVTAPAPPVEPKTPAVAPPETVSAPSPVEASAVEPTATQTEKRVMIETPLYLAEVSNKGAVLTSFRLKK